VRPFNRDGRDFIREAADSVQAASSNGEHAVVEPTRKEKRTRRHQESKGEGPLPASKPEPIPIPPTIAHFVMNLPASAITFLPSFRGLYHGHEALFTPNTPTKLPMIHVHCFAPKAEGDGPVLEVCERISAELGVSITLGDPEVPGRAAVHNVRTVAPNKDMFCASFRVPAEVAFAARP
jgi:tRNA (guanine37-N1)-methyltransferase